MEIAICPKPGELAFGILTDRRRQPFDKGRSRPLPREVSKCFAILEPQETQAPVAQALLPQAFHFFHEPLIQPAAKSLRNARTKYFSRKRDSDGQGEVGRSPLRARWHSAESIDDFERTDQADFIVGVDRPCAFGVLGSQFFKKDIR